VTWRSSVALTGFALGCRVSIWERPGPEEWVVGLRGSSDISTFDGRGMGELDLLFAGA